MGFGSRSRAVVGRRTSLHQRKASGGNEPLTFVDGKISPFRLALFIAFKVRSQRRVIVVKQLCKTFNSFQIDGHILILISLLRALSFRRRYAVPKLWA